MTGHTYLAQRVSSNETHKADNAEISKTDLELSILKKPLDKKSDLLRRKVARTEAYKANIIESMATMGRADNSLQAVISPSWFTEDFRQHVGPA